ncbi:GNAT family acetyltransferase [Rhodovulum imhoffii]|uniref:GNAT family acetyltransferase n=1 Tax=Rhodovulum imhoffii TaxID=365340 RepID=A0A2T5BNL6_9RHOB|nr:GNAT family N-acetyltransferase [Rhodovulum imhoffii]MBK5933774.1 hypothetical protein [Rhodovulum imhoffii]PTN00581.1 GNAT family acetyltransferase [Rhodovulum imhoffii]
MIRHALTRLRPARPGDGPAAYALFHAAVHEGVAHFYTVPERTAWAPAIPPPDWETRLLEGHGLIASRMGQMAGFMVMGADGFIDLAYVRPREMGRGVADILYAAQEAHARTLGLALLQTEASHLARRFFLRHGWRQVARQSVIRNGVTLTNFRMEKQLQADRRAAP